MTKFLNAGLMLAIAIGSAVGPALADPYDRAVEQEKTAAKNFKRSQNQQYKAQRDAAEGNMYGAQKHEQNAQLDSFKTRKNEARAQYYGGGW